MRAMRTSAVAALAVCWLGAAPAVAGEWQSRGEVAIEGRAFDGDGSDVTVDRGLGVLGRIEVGHAASRVDSKVRLFGRLDRWDKNRSTLVVEEAWTQLASERLRLRVGWDVVNWTATEAFHPADILNARNLDSDLENLEKLGEPMVQAQARLFGQTTLAVYLMPYRMAPNVTSPRSRLSFAPGQDLSAGRRMVDRDGDVTEQEWGPQAAVMVRQVLGSADLTVHAVEHVDRSQPLVRIDPMAAGGPRPFLLFQTVRQVGGTYQHAIDALLVKVEGAYRRFVDPEGGLPGVAPGLPPDAPPDPARPDPSLPDHGQVALGFEYGLTHEAGPESTLLLEGQALLGVAGEARRAALSVFQRDVLLGYRLAMNDPASKEFMVGAVLDLERAGEALVNVSYQQRLGETWTVRAGLRLFVAERDAPGPLSTLRRGDHVRLTLTRHF